jgi:hypothetical protein
MTGKAYNRLLFVADISAGDRGFRFQLIIQAVP